MPRRMMAAMNANADCNHAHGIPQMMPGAGAARRWVDMQHGPGGADQRCGRGNRALFGGIGFVYAIVVSARLSSAEVYATEHFNLEDVSWPLRGFFAHRLL